MKDIHREDLTFPENRVSLYSMDVTFLEDEAVFSECLRRMPEARREKVLRYRFPGDRRLSLAAGILLDRGLSERGIDYSTAPMKVNENGKPFLADADGIYFSVAHSGVRALVSFADVPVGCDTEVIKPDRDIGKLADRFYAPEEASEVRKNPDSFYRLWTLKESCVKAMGTGLTTELSEVTFDPDGEYYRHGGYVLISRKRGEYYEAVCVLS